MPRQARLRRITIDLTPVQPGGDNGGAKLVARSLVRELAELAPATEFVLLTAVISHAELADLDTHNVRRECVDADLGPSPPTTQDDLGMLGVGRIGARVLVNALVPQGTRMRVKDAVWTLVKRRRRTQVASSLLADLHFCPFTAPFFFDPRVALVTLVHDLQFLEYPEFFEEHQRQSRQKDFLDACRRADQIICVSEFVRRTVLAKSQAAPDRVHAVHSAVLHATQPDPNADAVSRRTLDALRIPGTRFLLYPANCWPHKNHRRLIHAFAEYLLQWPSSDLALVCTGAPGVAADELSALGQTLLPGGRFAFAGFLPEREFAALMQTCRALIYPSLYEGFGLPLLEAMACDRPILCSNTTSLPEVAGDAALLFDPLDPQAIVSAIARLESGPEVEHQLVQRGRARLASFRSARDMAAQYLDLFEQTVTARAGAG